jgi:hypothetical protein
MTPVELDGDNLGPGDVWMNRLLCGVPMLLISAVILWFGWKMITLSTGGACGV